MTNTNGIDELVALRTRVATLEEQLALREEKLAVLERESRRQLEQYVDAEMQSSNVANLYVASFRLHGTLEREQVLAAIREIIINLIGSEELLVFEVDEATGDLVLATQFGMELALDHWRNVPRGRGIVGRTAGSGIPFVAADHDNPREGAVAGEESLQAVIPLVVDGHTSGAIAIFRWLGHKRELEAVDRELFTLLQRQAASALYCTKLNARLLALAPPPGL